MTAAAHELFWKDLSIFVVHDGSVKDYPPVRQAPFDPGVAYLEYRESVSEKANPVYDMVRTALRLLRRDEPNYGTPKWNPLRGVVDPGMNVVVKPNLVADTMSSPGDLSALFTHMSVIRPILDYVRIALEGKGAITLGDAPIQRTDWEHLQRISGLDIMLATLNRRDDIPIELVDFRREVTIRNKLGVVVRREVRDEDHFREIDLAGGSMLMPIIGDYRRFRVSRYDPEALIRNHNPRRNCYMIHRRVLDADVVIHVPKLKGHKKAGISVGLKSMVGSVCGKDWLPHFRLGDAKTGKGDEYLNRSALREAHAALVDAMERGGKIKRTGAALLDKGIRGVMRVCGVDPTCEGNWYGNDTTWRMVYDLNLILCYATAEGEIRNTPQRRSLYIVDGIIGAEGNTPLMPTAHPAGTVVVGTNPIAVDAVAASAMGFDCQKVPNLRAAWECSSLWRLPPDNATLQDVTIAMHENDTVCRLDLNSFADRLNLAFAAPLGWAGHIERDR